MTLSLTDGTVYKKHRVNLISQNTECGRHFKLWLTSVFFCLSFPVPFFFFVFVLLLLGCGSPRYSSWKHMIRSESESVSHQQSVYTNAQKLRTREKKRKSWTGHMDGGKAANSHRWILTKNAKYRCNKYICVKVCVVEPSLIFFWTSVWSAFWDFLHFCACVHVHVRVCVCNSHL